MVRQDGAHREHPPAHRRRGQVPQQRGARPEEGQRRHIIGLAQAVGRDQLGADAGPGLEVVDGQHQQDVRAPPEIFDSQHAVPLGEVGPDLRPGRQRVGARRRDDASGPHQSFVGHGRVLLRQFQCHRQRHRAGRGGQIAQERRTLPAQLHRDGPGPLAERHDQIDPGDQLAGGQDVQHVRESFDGGGSRLAGVLPQFGEQLKNGGASA